MKTNFKLNKRDGFSLVELMVVVAIIGILAAIAVPNVNKYMMKARQSEAKTALASIYTANKAFHTEYNGYGTRFTVIGYGPDGQLRYNVGFQTDRDVTAAPPAGISGYNGTAGAAADSKGSSYCAAPRTCQCLVECTGLATLPASTADDTTFTASAASNLRKVATPSLTAGANAADVWTINQDKIITQTVDGIN